MRRPTQRERERVETGREQRETFTHNRERQDQREPDTQRWKPQLFSHLTSSGVTGVTMKHFPRITRQFYSRSPQSLPDGSFLRLKSPKNVGKSWKKLEKHEQVLEELGEWRPGQKSDFPAAPKAPEKIDFQSECASPRNHYFARINWPPKQISSHYIVFSGRGGHLRLHPHRVSPYSDSSRPLKSTQNLPELWSKILLERPPYLPLFKAS